MSSGSVFEHPERLTDVASWHGHIPFAFWLMENLQPSVFVELGTHKGDSYCAFLQAVAKFSLSTVCYAVDTGGVTSKAAFTAKTRMTICNVTTTRDFRPLSTGALNV